jgi:soluble lytic murein transglycosylase
LQAEILSGKAPKVAGRATALWLVDHSQAEECDPVFDYMRGAGLLTETLYRDRYELALSARRYSLARYLARSLDDARLAEAEAWLSAQGDPAAFLESAAAGPDIENQRERILWAVERIAFTDAPLAERYWRQIRRQLRFADTQTAALDRHIALWHARQHDPDALRRLNALPQGVTDDEVRRWQARVALAQHEWDDVTAIVAAMPTAQRLEEEWRYWHAVGLQRTGSAAEARDVLLELSRQRSYYGFLAADELGLSYAYDHVTVTPDHGVLQRLSESAAFIRARELFYVGLESRGRSEWDEAVAILSHDDKVQAGLLAHRWGWHSRAIATLAAAGQYDDLELRYPLPWPEEFAKAAATARIPSSWAYGVARSESLFIPDIRSQAGAIGIMQLMPSTGRRTAGELNLPYRGLATLTDPGSNIRLGATYLGKMLERFEENRVVATAAYNAGPSRVEKWLPESRSLDARIWIENIPYNETRDYVRRVLVSEAIFNWRLTGRTYRLSEGLRTIGAAPSRIAGTSP